MSARWMALLLAGGLALGVAYLLAHQLAERKLVSSDARPSPRVDLVRGALPVLPVSTPAPSAPTRSASVAVADENAPGSQAGSDVPAAPVPSSEQTSEGAAPGPQATADASSNAASAGAPNGPTAAPAVSRPGTIYRCRQGKDIVFSQWPCEP